MDSLCRVRNTIIYEHSWWTVSALPWVLFWCLFPSLLHISGNKHQNNPLVSVETVLHLSTYIILYATNISGTQPRKNMITMGEVDTSDLEAQSSNELQRPDYMTGHQHSCPNNGCQATYPTDMGYLYIFMWPVNNSQNPNQYLIFVSQFLYCWRRNAWFNLGPQKTYCSLDILLIKRSRTSITPVYNHGLISAKSGQN